MLAAQRRDLLLDRLRADGRLIAKDLAAVVGVEEDGLGTLGVGDERGEPTSFTAQWNDDMHHVLHTAATLESNGYYGDYKDDTEKLARALAEGF